MKPKNINSYLTSPYAGVWYNRYYDGGFYNPNNDDQRKHLDACSVFKQAVPRDEVTPDWVSKFYWQNEVAMNHSAMSDAQFLKSMLLSGYPAHLQKTSHVLLTSFFEPSDFDYENYIIRVPAERMVQHVKNVIFAEDIQFIFIESKQPGEMIPFIYDSSIESNAHLNTNDTMLKHRFEPGIQSIGWTFEIVHPLDWKWTDIQSTNKTAVTANKAASDLLSARAKKSIMDTLAIAASYPSLSSASKQYMDMNAINQIFNDIKNTSSYNNLDESDYIDMFNL